MLFSELCFLSLLIWLMFILALTCFHVHGSDPRITVLIDEEISRSQ